jgi:tetratricopeptide (TPR) repeat protein
MESYAVRSLAKARFRLGQPALAQLEWSLSICQSMGDRWGQAVTLRTLGELHLAEDRLDDAAACFDAAMALWESIEAPLWRARTERDIAQLLRARGEPEAAADVLAGAVRVFREYGAREYAEITGTAL